MNTLKNTLKTVSDNEGHYTFDPIFYSEKREFVSKEIAVELLDALKEAQRVCINQYGKDWETDFKFECDIINEAITNAEK